MMSRFTGGSLDCKWLADVHAREYIVPLRPAPVVAIGFPTLPRPLRFEVYRRRCARYVDGATRASEANRERVSHLEYEYIGERS